MPTSCQWPGQGGYAFGVKRLAVSKLLNYYTYKQRRFEKPINLETFGPKPDFKR
jgi:hypothetical protein